MKEDIAHVLRKNNIFQKLGVSRIGIFGSYARGERYKDIDLLLDEDPGYKKRELLKLVIEHEMQIPCDVVVKNRLEPIILYYLKKDLKYVEKS
jgi:predicted nucleotidyltransferase